MSPCPHELKGLQMSGFWSQLGVMALTFGLALLPGLASRRMERSDYLTLLAIPPTMGVVAVLPGILIWGFNKDSATYLLGVLVVIIVATLNYRFQPRRTEPGTRDDALIARERVVTGAPKEA